MLVVKPNLDAVSFCNDDLAQGALMAAPHQGVAVAGFNDLSGSDQMLPTLTLARTTSTQQAIWPSGFSKDTQRQHKSCLQDQPHADTGSHVMALQNGNHPNTDHSGTISTALWIEKFFITVCMRLVFWALSTAGAACSWVLRVDSCVSMRR